MRTAGLRRLLVPLSAVALAVAGAAGAAGVPAQAAATAGAGEAGAAPASVSEALEQRLGARSAGSYLSGGRLIVTVTDAAGAAEVRAAGATPRVVARSGAALAAAQAALGRTARVPGTAWGVDPVRNQVVVSVDSSVTGARLARVTAAVRALGASAALERVAGTFRPMVIGGQAIYGSGYRCSLGFNVRRGGTYYFLTAGHCTNVADTWYSDPAQANLLGSRTRSSFPDDDFGIVRYAQGQSRPPGTVTLGGGTFQDITGAGTPTVGEAVRRSGSTSGTHSGTVLELDATVNYAQGTVDGLIRTNVCAEPGDSGGPLFGDGASASTAYGLTSGGSGDCLRGGTTYYQPVVEPLSLHQVVVY